MPVFMIHSRHRLQMKYWRMLAERKLTHSQMASQGTIRSRSRQKIGVRQPSQPNGAFFNTSLCPLDIFTRCGGHIQGIHPQVLRGISGLLECIWVS